MLKNYILVKLSISMNDEYTVSLDSIRGKTSGGHVTSNYTGNTYSVEHMAGNSDSWTCSCKSFLNAIRTGADSKTCRHMAAYMEEMNRPKERHGAMEATLDSASDVVIACTGCGSTHYTKAGRKSGKQVYQCKSCKRRFVCTVPGFEKLKHSPEVVTSALNMVMSGMSYRKTAEQLYYANNIRVSHVTILYWVRKYTLIIKGYTDALKPITGDVWSVDEAVINVKNTKKLKGKGNVDWLWSAIDPKTRFVLASIVSSDNRTSKDAEATLRLAKKIGIPNYLVTDSLSAYDSAAAKAIPRTFHIKTNSIRDGFTNMAIERYHNEIREKLKSCRGLGNDDSAAIFANLLLIHHNFIRPHMGLDGKTPAEKAGAITAHAARGKYRSLIRDAAVSDLLSDRTLARRLGRRAGLVTIDAGAGNVRVLPSRWIGNDDWRTITLLLSEVGFVWLFTSISRCWIKFANGPPRIMPATRKRLTPV